MTPGGLGYRDCRYAPWRPLPDSTAAVRREINRERDVEHQEFDDFSRVLAAPGARRAALGALAGLLGLRALSADDAAGESKTKRRRQRRRVSAKRCPGLPLTRRPGCCYSDV